jgi:hypothetical protein
MFDCDDEKLRLVALQAHQISGSIDPRVPTRVLLDSEEHRGWRIERSLSNLEKLNDPEIGNHINERLAPGGFN